MVFICVIMQTYISAFSAQTVIVDEKYVDTVTVNGTVVTLDADGGLCLTIDLAVLNTADYRLNIIKRYTVGAKVWYVNIFINKHYINNIFSL